jgi:hypothetical protein
MLRFLLIDYRNAPTSSAESLSRRHLPTLIANQYHVDDSTEFDKADFDNGPIVSKTDGATASSLQHCKPDPNTIACCSRLFVPNRLK